MSSLSAVLEEVASSTKTKAKQRANPQWWVGRTFTRKLSNGENAFGDVYQVTYEGGASAIKISPYKGPEKAVADREIEVLGKLNRLKSSKVEGDWINIEMDYYPGERLDQFLRNHTLTVEQRCRLAILIVREFNHLHQVGFIHADAHAQNCLVNYDKLIAGDDDAVHLIDFGLAREIGKKISPLPGNAKRSQYPPEFYDHETEHTFQVSADCYAMGYFLAIIFSLNFKRSHQGFSINLKKLESHPSMTEGQFSKILQLIEAMRSKDVLKRPEFESIEKSLLTIINAKELHSSLCKALKANDTEVFRNTKFSDELFRIETGIGWNILQDALLERRKDIAKIIIEKSDLDVLKIRHKNTPTAIHLAAWFGDWDIVKLLIKRGISINESSVHIYSQRDGEEGSPKLRFNHSDSYAQFTYPDLLANTEQWGLLGRLIENVGFDQLRFSQNETIYHKLAKSNLNKYELIYWKNLIAEQNSIDLNQVNANGNTALHEAAKRGNTLIVELLLQAGAKMQANGSGKRSINLANDALSKIDPYRGNDAKQKSQRYKSIIQLLEENARLQKAEQRLISKIKTKRSDFHHYSKKFREVAIESPKLFASYLKRQLGKKSTFPVEIKEKAQTKLRNLACVACCPDRDVQHLLMPEKARDAQVEFLKILQKRVEGWQPKRKVSSLFKKSLPKSILKLKTIFANHDLDKFSAEKSNCLLEQSKVILKTYRAGRFAPKFFSHSKAFCREQYKAAVELNEVKVLGDAMEMKL